MYAQQALPLPTAGMIAAASEPPSAGERTAIQHARETSE
jgi:hypothetical protein